MSLARVVVAAIRKRNFKISSKAEDYYHGEDTPKEIVASTPIKSFEYELSDWFFVLLILLCNKNNQVSMTVNSHTMNNKSLAEVDWE